MLGDLKRAGGNALIYGAGNVGTALMAFLLLPIVTRRLTPEEFGLYSLMSVTLGVLLSLADGGLTNAVARYYFDHPGGDGAASRGRMQVVSTATVTAVATASAVAGACALMADWMAIRLFKDASCGPLLRLVAATVFCRGFTVVPMILLRVQERSTIYAVLTVVQMGSFVALTVWYVAFRDFGVTGMLYGQLGSTCLWAALAVATTIGDLRQRPHLGLLRELLRFGLPFLPVLLLSWIVDFSDRYLLDLYGSARDVGLYSLGYRFGQIMSLVVTAFTLAWSAVRFRLLAGPDPKAAYARVANLYVAGAGAICLALSVSAPWLIHVTCGPDYHDASIFVTPVAFGYYAYGLFVLAVTGLGVVKQTGGIVVASLAGAIANVGLNFLLIPVWGGLAAALTTLVAYALMACVGFWLSQRVYRIPYQYEPWIVLVGTIVALLGAASGAERVAAGLGVAVRVLSVPLYVAVALRLAAWRSWDGLDRTFLLATASSAAGGLERPGRGERS